jgi:predicted hydrocarbon binding protein
MKDRYKRFAETWKSISLSKRIRWKGYRIHEDLKGEIIARFISNVGERANRIIGETYYQAGWEDGKKLSAFLGIDRKDVPAMLAMVETICLMSGLETKVVEKGPSLGILSVKGCPFHKFLSGLEYPTNTVACSEYTQGIIASINRDAKVKMNRRYCEGDETCTFRVSVETI